MIVNCIVNNFCLIIGFKHWMAMGRAKAKEFTREVDVLLNLRHKNLVKLLGYCFEGYYRYYKSSIYTPVDL